MIHLWYKNCLLVRVFWWSQMAWLIPDDFHRIETIRSWEDVRQLCIHELYTKSMDERCHPMWISNCGSIEDGNSGIRCLVKYLLFQSASKKFKVLEFISPFIVPVLNWFTRFYKCISDILCHLSFVSTDRQDLLSAASNQWIRPLCCRVWQPRSKTHRPKDWAGASPGIKGDINEDGLLQLV